MILDSTNMQNIWTDTVVPFFDVPATLFEHQADAMTLLRKQRNVFLGKKFSF